MPDSHRPHSLNRGRVVSSDVLCTNVIYSISTQDYLQQQIINLHDQFHLQNMEQMFDCFIYHLFQNYSLITPKPLLTFRVMQVPAYLGVGLVQEIDLLQKSAQDPSVRIPHRWSGVTSTRSTPLPFGQRSRDTGARGWTGRVVALIAVHSSASWQSLWTVVAGALGPIDADVVSTAHCCHSIATDAHILIVRATGVAAKSGIEEIQTQEN